MGNGRCTAIKWQFCVLLLLLGLGVSKSEDTADASLEKNVQADEGGLEMEENMEKRGLDVDDIQQEGDLENELEEGDLEHDDSLDEEDLENENIQEEGNQENDDSLEEGDLENDDRLEEGDLENDDSLEERDLENGESQEEGDVELEDNMEEGTLQNENNMYDSKPVSALWFEFGRRRRCFCNIVGLDSEGIPKKKLYTFKTVRTRRSLFCSRRVTRFCRATCVRRFLRLVSRKTCLPDQLCQRVKTTKKPWRLGLLLSSRHCFRPRILWRSSYRLSCNNGTSVVS